ncbi:hypothetical protein TPHA_0M00380 [Tetrapisispora phaffii CBS 4417]|uniref:BHLH domain-containing protein n=1 Tax=Tetrapisispora phaffii (strain ATCC 24235 / CBS 4417 / NBRC 1672 / NRRL Y-8282 / UCD 70-5) TaxID=1071381 RepID=G8C0V2_TETPH|nr:hypothetical protein TPHA_0M00380 [Tetrapisispora phaffii CBS 4417]CCE65613.1 hypothetical protein TPHA_0M00380 [Tetrapisispora phaffii CBS 4417]
MTSVPDSVESFSETANSSQPANVTIERLRRDNMNEKIQEILNLIPTEFFEEHLRAKSASANTLEANSLNDQIKASGTKDGKPNKGQILTQAVEYIIHLQNEIDANNREEVDMLAQLQELSKQKGVIVNDVNLENTIAEEMLAKIGVGPLSAQNEENKTDLNARKETSNNQQTQKLEYGGYSEYGNGL